jgi:hypothetical protein
MSSGHYEIEPETATRAKGVLRIIWVEPTGNGPRRTHVWNMGAPRLALLGQAITDYMRQHPEQAEGQVEQPTAFPQPFPQQRRDQ